MTKKRSRVRQPRRIAGTPPQPDLSPDELAWLHGLVPLMLEPQGVWEPDEEYWGEEDEPIPEWAKPIIARGPRPQFEMQQVIPGFDPDDPDCDPILEANELTEAGQEAQARQLLLRVIEKDVRCLDAHAHLGNLLFPKDPGKALGHYEMGVQIGRQALGEKFDGVLPWGLIDNRPFLRCMHGYGLCLWRLQRFEEAQRQFEQLLWMCPSDNIGVRFLLREVLARRKWREDVG